MSFPVVVPETVGFSSERLARIAPVMRTYTEQRGFSGISTLIARRGKIVHFEQVGYQDRDERTPLRPDTIYRIYSMTKSFTCVALMMLYEEGRFHLFEPVSKYIPSFANLRVYDKEHGTVPLERPVLIHNLITHTSGLTYDFMDDNPVAALYREAGLMGNVERTLEEMIDELARLPLAYQPGTRWHYSLGIDVAARLVEIISGQRLQDFFAERIFKPLGMEDTGFSVPAEKHHRVAIVYGLPDISYSTYTEALILWQQGYNERIDLTKTHPLDNTTTFARGGHGLYSTSLDFLRFAQMMLNRGELDGVRLLGRKTIEFMLQNHIPQHMLPYYANNLPVEGVAPGIGFTMLTSAVENKSMNSVGSFMSGGAAKTSCWVDPQEEVIGILMTQALRSFELPEKTLQVLTYQALID